MITMEPDDLVDIVHGLQGKPIGDEAEDDFGIFIPWDDLAEADINFNVATEGKQPKIGPMQRLHLLRKFAQSGQRLRDWRRLSDDQILESLNKVAVAKGIVRPSAIGDGTLFKTFLEFITEHWDDILKILLALLGLAI